jgi:hypothetical protein
MSKKEWKSVTTGRNWGEISDKITSDYLNCVLSFADEMHKFYFDHIGDKRCWSITLRLTSVIFFAVALILVLSIGFIEDKKEFWVLTMNVGALVIASLCLLIDRQFGLSEGWMRYTQAQFEIEKVLSEYQAQFISINPSGDSKEDLKKLQIDTILNLDKSLRTIIIDETSNWSLNLRNQITALTNKVDSELSSARQKFETAQNQMKTKKEDEEKAKRIEENEKASAAEKGILVLKFNYKKIKSGQFTIDGKTYKIQQMQDSKVISDLNQKYYKVEGIIELEEGVISFERAIKITGGINEYIIASDS